MYCCVDFREYQSLYRYYNIVCNTPMELFYYTASYADVCLHYDNDNSPTLNDAFFNYVATGDILYDHVIKFV